MGGSSGYPETSTAEVPPPDTTAAAASQIATPTMSDVSVTVQPDDNAEHHPNSLQVAKDAVLTLNWSSSNAAGVRIDPLGSFGPSGLQQISTEDATFTLVALGENGEEGTSWPMEIHTHEPGQVVSPHSEVSSGVAKVVSFQALIGGQ